MEFCSCKSEVETLLDAKLFPATPKQPQLVFTFDFLDWLEALTLECQIAVRDFADAVDFLTESKILQVYIV